MSFKSTTDKVLITKKNAPFPFTNEKTGEVFNCYSVNILDNGYTVRVSCSEEFFNSVQENEQRSLDLDISFWRNKPRVKIVG